MKKRLFTLAAAVCLTLCLAVGANAASVVASGSCGGEDSGTNLKWTLNSNGALTISGSGIMMDYPGWLDYADEIRTVSISNSVTSIGAGAFYECAALTSLTIPNGVTEIGDSAFYGCASLQTVALGSGVVNIGSGAFDGCASLTAITVSASNQSFRAVNGILFSAYGDALYAYPAGKTQTAYQIPSTVTTVGEYAFSGCRSLVTVTMTDSVVSIETGAFMNCDKLKNADLPDSVTSIGANAFSGCASLTSVVIPWDVTTIGASAFSGCTGLTAIEVNEDNYAFHTVDGVLFDAYDEVLYAYPAGREASFYLVPYGVSMIGAGAFKGCENLTEVAFSDSVASINEFAFAGCSALTELTIPYSVSGIGEYAFQDCEALTDVYYGSTEEDWEYCTILMGNDCLTDAEIHFTEDPESVDVIKFGLNDGLARVTVYAPPATTVYLAVYDDEGRFLGVEARQLDYFGSLVTLTIAEPEASSAKLMLADDAGIPLCAAEES